MKKQEATTLRSELKQYHGSIAEVVRRTKEIKENGFTRQYVDYILHGNGQNIAILNIAADVLKERKEKRVNQTKRFRQLMERISATA